MAHFTDQETQWDISRLREFVPMPLIDVIRGIFIPMNHNEDKLVCALAPDGCNTVKSGVALLQGYGLDVPSPESFIWIWRLCVHPKIIFFLWKICNNEFPQKKIRDESHLLASGVCFL